MESESLVSRLGGNDDDGIIQYSFTSLLRTHRVAGHDVDLGVVVVQQQVAVDRGIGLDGGDGVRLHLTV